MKSTLWFRSFVSLAAFTLSQAVLTARPVDLSIPGGGYGSAGTDGSASHWLEMSELDFGDGFSLPLRLSFESTRVGGATDFGAGSVWWRAPELHARIMSRREQELSVLLPCGKLLTLEPKADSPGQFHTPDDEWIGKVVDGSLLVSREDGWELEYSAAGWLVRLRNDAGRIVFYNRDPGGRLISITENDPAAPDGKVKTTGLLVKRDATTGNVTSLDAWTASGLKSFTLVYDDQQRLASVAFPDGSTETYAYLPAADGNPQITITSRDLVKRTLVWNADSRLLVSDGAWTYGITPQTGSRPKITRTGPNGETETSWDDSKKSGTITFTAADGTTTIRQQVKAGPAKGKIETISRLLPGAKEPVITYKAAYDAKGMLTDEWDALDHKTSHSYVLFGGSAHSGIAKHTKTDPLGRQTIEEYDKRGNLTATTDTLGHVTRHAYDAQNRRVSSFGPDGAVTEKVSYTRQGWIASRTDAAGNVTRYGYDQEGHRISSIDALGHETKDAFDVRGNKIKSTDALGRTWTFEYDAGGRLARQLDPEGKETARFGYDERGRRVTTTDAAGNTTTTTYDALDRITSRTDALGRGTLYAYEVQHGSTGCQSCNAGAMPTLITMPSGRKVQRVYDADRRMIEETTAFATPDAATTRYAYDAAGSLLRVTDPLGRVTEFAYDAAGQRTGITNPDKTTRSYAYDAAGNLIAETDELGAVTKRTYDAHGNLISVTDATGAVTQFLYEGKGTAALHRLTGTLLPSSARTDFEFDALNHRIAEIKGAPDRDAALAARQSTINHPLSTLSVTRHEFDAVGNETLSTDPMGRVRTHTYDARNRRVQTSDALGRKWFFTYSANSGPSGPAPCCGAAPEANSKAAETTYPDGTKESTVLDAAGQTIEKIDANGGHTQFAYDPDGRLETLTDARGSVTRWKYDARGKLAAKVYPDKTMELYEHDAAGQMIRRVRPDGTAAVYAYDLRGKLISTRWDGDRTEPSDFAYDPTGRMTKAANQSAIVEREYDARGKMTKEKQTITAFAPGRAGLQPAANESPEKSQGAAGTVGVPPSGGQGRSDDKAPSGKSAATEPPKGGTPTAPSSPPPAYEVTYTYNADGQLHALRYPDGTIVTYLYNNRGEISEVLDSTLSSLGLTPTAAKYTRNLDGSIAQLTMGNGLITTKTYDKAGRLTRIEHAKPKVGQASGLPENKNTNATGTVAPPSEILWSETLRYDDRDRRTARIHQDGTADLFAYDPAGQVTAAAYGQASTVAITAPRDEPQTNPSSKAGDSSRPNDVKNEATTKLASAIASPSSTPHAPSFQPQQTFAYDPAGNRTRTTDNGQTTDYQTNENNQYTALDANGTPYQPEYDKLGNLLHDSTRKYTWDADIHLLSVETKSEIGNPKSSIAQFRYDALHRRVARIESGTTVPVVSSPGVSPGKKETETASPPDPQPVTTYFVMDGWNVIAEYESSAGLQPSPSAPTKKASASRKTEANSSAKATAPIEAPGHPLKRMTTLAKRHVWSEDLSRTLQGAGGIGGLITSTFMVSPRRGNSRASQAHFFSYDSNGNVILLTGIQHLTTAKYGYDAFGKTIAAIGSAAGLNRYRLSTKPVELASGLAFYGFRYYDPKLGRWSSRDPIKDTEKTLILGRRRDFSDDRVLTNMLNATGKRPPDSHAPIMLLRALEDVIVYQSNISETKGALSLYKKDDNNSVGNVDILGLEVKDPNRKDSFCEDIFENAVCGFLYTAVIGLQHCSDNCENEYNCCENCKAVWYTYFGILGSLNPICAGFLGNDMHQARCPCIQ